MAIAFIREIRNHCPNSKLRIRVQDDGRHPSLNGVTYGKEDWMSISNAKSANNPTVVEPDNMGIPWSYGGKQRLIIQTEINGVVKNISAEIRGRDAWDFMLLRDNELQEIGETEVGSLGDAPGVNHSWWGLVLHSNGKLEFHLFERQGLRRDDLLSIVNAAGSIFIDLLPEVIKVVVEVIPVLL